jgi:hypothetical protein
MLDYNIAPDYKKLKSMFEIANFRENREVLEEVLEKGFIVSPLVSQFSFEMPFGKIEFINLLYYLGNLTIKGARFGELVEFKIPNRFIEELYWKYYGHLLRQEAGITQSLLEIPLAVEAMARTGKTEEFFSHIQKLLQELSNRDYRGFSEKYIKMAIIAYVMQLGLFYIQSEREVKGGGYIDLDLYIRPNNPARHCQFALEIKYLKKEEEAQKDRAMREAKAQLLRYYERDELLQSKSQLHLAAVVVVKDKVYIEEAFYNEGGV